MSLVPYVVTAIRSDDDGTRKNVVPFVLCTILNEIGTPATVYSNQAGTPLANPFLLDYKGQREIWLEPGIYSQSVAGSELIEFNVSPTESDIDEKLSLIVAGERPVGAWDADTNTPALTNSSGNVGDVYYVSVPGSTDLNGETDWDEGTEAVKGVGGWFKRFRAINLAQLNSALAAFLVTLYNIFPRKINTWAEIASTPVIGAGQLFTLAQHTSGGIGGGTLMAFAGSVADDGGTQKNSATVGFYLKRINYDFPTIEMFGGGIGGNDQSALSSLYNAHSTLFLGPKDYLIDNLNIRKAFTIITCGFKSRLIQNTGVTGTNQQISVITVAASDVSIQDIALVGTISTDAGEDRHGIRVDASTVPGGISNIHIGNVNAANMRGDAIVLTGSAGRDVKNFSIGNVNGFNIFRNGVSVVSGIGGKIGVVTVAQEGLFAFDSEPDTSGGIVEGLFVEGVRGRHCGVPAVGSVQRGITFGFVDLDWSLPQSTPAFTPIQDSEQHGLVFRSTNGCFIEYCRLRNFPESPVRVYKEASDAFVDNIGFGTLIIENCLTNTSNPPCLIRSAGSKNITVRGTLKYTCTNPALHELILDGSATGFVRLSANRIEGNAPIGRYIAVDCQSSEISYTADRTCLIFLGNCTFNNAKWDVGVISSSSSGLLTFTSSVLKWSGSFKYADGLGTNFHTYEINSSSNVLASDPLTWAATRVDG